MADVADAEAQGCLYVWPDAYFREITAFRTMIAHWRTKYDHATPELDKMLKKMDAAIKEAEGRLNSVEK